MTTVSEDDDRETQARRLKPVLEKKPLADDQKIALADRLYLSPPRLEALLGHPLTEWDDTILGFSELLQAIPPSKLDREAFHRSQREITSRQFDLLRDYLLLQLSRIGLPSGTNLHHDLIFPFGIFHEQHPTGDLRQRVLDHLFEAWGSEGKFATNGTVNIDEIKFMHVLGPFATDDIPNIHAYLEHTRTQLGISDDCHVLNIGLHELAHSFFKTIASRTGYKEKLEGLGFEIHKNIEERYCDSLSFALTCEFLGKSDAQFLKRLWQAARTSNYKNLWYQMGSSLDESISSYENFKATDGARFPAWRAIEYSIRLFNELLEKKEQIAQEYALAENFRDLYCTWCQDKGITPFEVPPQFEYVPPKSEALSAEEKAAREKLRLAKEIHLNDADDKLLTDVAGHIQTLLRQRPPLLISDGTKNFETHLLMLVEDIGTVLESRDTPVAPPGLKVRSSANHCSKS